MERAIRSELSFSSLLGNILGEGFVLVVSLVYPSVRDFLRVRVTGAVVA